MISQRWVFSNEGLKKLLMIAQYQGVDVAVEVAEEAAKWAEGTPIDALDVDSGWSEVSYAAGG